MSDQPRPYAPWHLAVVILTGIYLLVRMDQGWIPHDEGLLGQSAVRVIDGDRPHVNFDDPYTGGLAYLHAAAFGVLGVSSAATRILLLLFSLPMTSLIFCLASRLAVPWVAALLTSLAIAWSLPNYFAALPSWYNLFFALTGTWCLVKYDESHRKAWLIAGGLAGGFSFLFKLSGLFFVAAGWLFLVYREQDAVYREQDTQPHETNDDEAADAHQDGVSQSGWAFPLLTSMALAAFVGALLVVVRNRLTIMDGLHFVVPGASLSALLIFRQWKENAVASTIRFRRLATNIAWFTLGVILPIGCFLIPYALNGHLADFVNGVLILPQKRIQWTDYPLPPLISLLASLPLLLALGLPLLLKRGFSSLSLTVRFSLILGLAIVATMTSLLGSFDAVYQTVWYSARPIVPISVLIGCWMLLRNEADGLTGSQKRFLFLLLAVASMTSLIQFPYSFGIYFCYAAPAVILAVAAVALMQPNSPRPVHLVLGGFYLAFAVIWLNHGNVRRIGVRYVPQGELVDADIERLGLQVSLSDADLYSELVDEVQRHSDEGSFIYACNDCPEVYFLAERKNPTRTFYEFFDADYTGDLSERVERLTRILEQHDVRVVVFHWRGEFSGPVSYEFAAELAQRYPNAKHIMRERSGAIDPEPVFTVAW